MRVGKAVNKQLISGYIYKLRTYPVRIILAKVLRKLYLKIYRLHKKRLAYSNLNKTDRKLPSQLNGFSTEQVQNSRSLNNSDFNNKLSKLMIPESNIYIADSIISGRFEVLGRLCNFNDGFKWNVDFTSGYLWDATAYYTDICYGFDGIDIKIPWELSRLQFIWPLLSAFILSGDKKYINKLTEIVMDWIDKNPVSFGPGWACTMDVGIRAANLALIRNWLRVLGLSSNDQLSKILISLHSHGIFILDNLEYGEMTSNHYLSNIVGLIYIGVLCPEFNRSDEWLAYGLQELISEMQRQVNEDGSDFEASTCYHRLVTELFLSATIIASQISHTRRERIKNYNYKLVKPIVGPRLKPVSEQEFSFDDPQLFPGWYLDRLEKMLEFTMHISKPDGNVPQFGDNDSGRLHKFTPIGSWNSVLKCFDENFLDHRHLLAVGGEFFNRDDFREIGLPYSEETFWYNLNPAEIGEKKSIADKQSQARLQRLTSKAFPNFGLYVMRQGSNYMAIRCGDIGQKKNGGHAHNDQLSFELQIGGEDIFLDPGTYLYTPSPEWRNSFRSTANHNTIIIDGEEQNRFFDWSIFAMQDDAKARCLHWESDNQRDVFEGEHYGYQRLPDPVIHKRKIIFHKQDTMWVVEDSFPGESKHLLQWNYIMVPDVEIRVIDCFTIEISTKKKVITLKREFSSTVKIEEAHYSTKYGAQTAAKLLKVVADCKEYKYVTKIYV